MKLYAKVSSERATKGQGGNERIEIDLLDENERRVGYIKFWIDDKIYVDWYPEESDTRQNLLTKEIIKSKKQKGKCDGCIVRNIQYCNHD